MKFKCTRWVEAGKACGKKASWLVVGDYATLLCCPEHKKEVQKFNSYRCVSLKKIMG